MNDTELSDFEADIVEDALLAYARRLLDNQTKEREAITSAMRKYGQARSRSKERRISIEPR